MERSLTSVSETLAMMNNDEIAMFWKLGSALARAKKNNVVDDPQFQQASLAYNELKNKMYAEIVHPAVSEVDADKSHRLSSEEVNEAFMQLVQTCQICSALEAEFLKDQVSEDMLEVARKKRIDAINKVAVAVNAFLKANDDLDQDQ